MARKRVIEEPPPAVSSSDEEKEESEEEASDNEEEHKGTVETHENGTIEEQNDDGSEDNGEEEDDDEEADKENPIMPFKASKPTSDSDSGSESDSDSAVAESTEPPSPSVSDFTIKQISPKPKPGATSEQSKKEKHADDKKPKRAMGGPGGFPRLWSDEDEIVILNGMIDYQKEKGKNPWADIGDFHEFVKESLHVDATNAKLLDKIRRLKKKYHNDVEKHENSKDNIFSKQHDLECLELAKQIWGSGAFEVGSKGNTSNKGANLGGRGAGGITLALEKKKVDGEKGDASVKKEKRSLREELNGEAKEGNVKRGKRGLSEEVNEAEKGKGGKKEKRFANEEVNGDGEEANVKKQRRVGSEEMELSIKRQGLNEKENGKEKELSVIKQKTGASEEVDGEEEDGEDFWEKYPLLFSSLRAENFPNDLMEKTMGMVEEGKLVEFEEEWMSLAGAKLELFVKERELVSKQIKSVLNTYKSRNSPEL